jgi:hypothetical protein
VPEHPARHLPLPHKRFSGRFSPGRGIQSVRKPVVTAPHADAHRLRSSRILRLARARRCSTLFSLMPRSSATSRTRHVSRSQRRTTARCGSGRRRITSRRPSGQLDRARSGSADPAPLHEWIPGFETARARTLTFFRRPSARLYPERRKYALENSRSRRSEPPSRRLWNTSCRGP